MSALSEVKVKGILYENQTMVCEFVGCQNGVSRSYHPYCARCYRHGILKGRFESRDGKLYFYNGRNWVVCCTPG